SAEVHVCEGCRTELVRIVSDVVMAVDVHFLKANDPRWARLLQVELAVAEHDLVAVAKVLVKPQGPRVLVVIGGRGEEDILPVYRRGTAMRDDRLVQRGDRIDAAGRDAVDTAIAVGRVGLVVFLSEGLARVLAVDEGGRRGIVDRNHVSALVDKAGEVAIPHRVSRSEPAGLGFGGESVAFPRHKKERPILAVVQLRNGNRAAERCAKLVLPEGIALLFKKAPRIHLLVAQKLPK